MMMWLAALALPFLFIIGIVYSAIKDQKRLEAKLLPKILAERARKAQAQQEAAAKKARTKS